MARPATNLSTMTGLWRVKPGKNIKWPESIMNPIQHPMRDRGKAGYVVDLDRKEESMLLFGQERFLEPVPKGELDEARGKVKDQQSYPRPILNELVNQKLVKRLDVRRGSRRDKLKDNAADQPKPKAGGLPGLDTTPTGSRTKRTRPTTPKEDSDAGQSTPGADEPK